MAMSVEINMSDGTCILVRSTGGYAPDVMYDLQNRAAALLSHAAGVNLQVMRAVSDIEDSRELTADDEPVTEDEAAE